MDNYLKVVLEFYKRVYNIIRNNSRNTDMESERGLNLNIKNLRGEGCSFPNCKDDTFNLNLCYLYDPMKCSSYISKCMTMAGKDKRFVIYRKIFELLPRLAYNNKLFLNGSVLDGSDIRGSDLDYLGIVESSYRVPMDKGQMKNGINFVVISDECFLVDLSSTPSGFTKLFSISDGKYLSNSCLPLIEPDLDIMKVNQVGPSLQTSTLEGELISDIVPVISCSDWPLSYRQRWIHRPRPFGWPPKHVVEDLSKTSCFVVPVGREDSKESHLEWRFVFPFVERGLVWAFNTIQLQCFVLLKVFNKTFLKKIDNVSDGISSFHIKMVMFWECEKSHPKDWSKKKLFDCVRRCLRRLRLAIQKKKLKHYIIEERNVLVTKLKNSETREKVAKKIQSIENDISGSIINSILEGANHDLLIQMIHFQHTSQNARTSLDLDFNNRLAWVDQVNLVDTTYTIMAVLNEHWLKLLLETNTSNKIDRINIFRKIKNDINIKYIPCKTISDFMKDIHLIASDSVSNEAIEQILLQIFRILNAYIDMQIGSELFDKAIKTQGVQKEKMLLDAERNFKKGIELDCIAGHLYLVTFYLACGNDESAENVLVSLLTQNRILVTSHAMAILINDGNIKITSGISHNYRQRGYASRVLFSNKDLELVPDVLKYEICTEIKEQILNIHPFVYAKYFQINFSIKSKSRFVTQYIEELRQSLMKLHRRKTATKSFDFIYFLAYCYRQIGAINKAIYLYTLRCKKSDMFHLAFLLNRVKKSN